MQAVRNMLRATPQLARSAIIPQRNMSAIPVPARNKVSKGELIFLSVVMVFGWSAVPAWVLVNIKNYRNKE